MINVGADVVDDEVIFVVFENFEHDWDFFGQFGPLIGVYFLRGNWSE